MFKVQKTQENRAIIGQAFQHNTHFLFFMRMSALGGGFNRWMHLMGRGINSFNLNQLTRLSIELKTVHAGMTSHPQGMIVRKLDAEHERADQAIHF